MDTPTDMPAETTQFLLSVYVCLLPHLAKVEHSSTWPCMGAN